MDTINIILQEANKTNSIDFVTIITIIKDIATIAAILVGIYFGHKGLKRFLLDDLIKSKISDLHNTNQEVFQFTKKIISTIINKEDLNRPADENDLSYIKKQTQKLVKLSNGASKEVATLSFFLNETVRKIRPKIKSKTYVERLMAPDIFNLLYNTSVKINQFSSNIIDLPRRIQLEPYNEINKSLHKFLNREDTHKIKGIQFGKQKGT